MQQRVDLSSLALGLDQPEFWARTDAELARDPALPHAPIRPTAFLTAEEKRQAVRNVLRYFAPDKHALLAKEFARELREYGHIYAYRFRPTKYAMRAYPVDWYPAKCNQAGAIMVMIQNNLDPAVAQYPHELITYGGNGSVFSNWAQYHIVLAYLARCTMEQTLALYSGHPLGLFPSHPDAPRVVITNGMVIPNHSTRQDYDRLYALGVSQYGQMTAGSFCYIGPQGIVHGTTITLMNAARKYQVRSQLPLFVSAGLGGMSGAQPKAAVIAKMIGVIAEVDERALNKRHSQGWVNEKCTDLQELISRIRRARSESTPVSIGFLGNVVDVWEALAAASDLTPDLGSDQTSLHNPYGGGYYPVGLTFAESQRMMAADPEQFKQHVHASLRRHVAAINVLTARGMRFFDYGNAFLLEASRAGADIMQGNGRFKYPSYVEDIMGDVFSLGFGPFRWVCTSGRPEDLATTDQLAAEVLAEQMREAQTAPDRELAARAQQHFTDNHVWITQSAAHALVVGSQARILYANAAGRARIAHAFNAAIAQGRLHGPVMLSRDHHDVSGTDSPYRETANIRDGSQWTADMAVQNAIGDAMRGATMVALHNGGGVGWGEVINGGFLLLLDGTPEAARRADQMLFWDVNNGIARRAWSGNANAAMQIADAERSEPRLQITRAQWCTDAVLDAAGL